MSDWEEQLNSILNDPAQMSRIADMARTLMGGEGPPAAEAAEAAPTESALPAGLGEMLRSLNGGEKSDKQALLEAMKPWLSEKRRAKMDRALRLARMARLAELAMGEGERHDV